MKAAKHSLPQRVFCGDPIFASWATHTHSRYVRITTLYKTDPPRWNPPPYNFGCIPVSLCAPNVPPRWKICFIKEHIGFRGAKAFKLLVCFLFTVTSIKESLIHLFTISAALKYGYRRIPSRELPAHMRTIVFSLGSSATEDLFQFSLFLVYSPGVQV